MVQNLQQQQYLKAGRGAGAGAQLRLSYFICFIRLKRGQSYLLKSVLGKNLLLGGEKKKMSKSGQHSPFHLIEKSGWGEAD